MNRVRCAIYTRKSSEEGLEQDFNSLDAQRDACAAYVASQASEGWHLLPARYDDGGVSGGTLERPALQRLLADVAAGKVDIIVVYKVDRLTRSLLDFARLVEALDRAGTSFVSVTQSFNTTTSMGRLTLNMLLSFAQFEREVTAERIRDKIAASKAKGMWMGGTPPIGYAPAGRSLTVIDGDAQIIRTIFARYLELGNVRLLAAALLREGVRSPRRQRAKTGAFYGGTAFSRGQLYAILRCPVYVGDIPHKGRTFRGLHQPIIAQDIWERTAALLASNRQGHRSGTRAASPGLLAGKVFEAGGAALGASHAVKGPVRYRYYVGRGEQPLRIPARELEELVVGQITALFSDPLALVSHLCIPGADLPRLQRRCAEFTAAGQARAILAEVVERVSIAEAAVSVGISLAGLTQVLGLVLMPGTAPMVLTARVRLTRSGRAMRLIDGGGGHASGPGQDPSLARLIARARRWWGMLAEGHSDIRRLAEQERVTASYMTRVVRLAFLSPRVIEAAVAGKLRAGIDAATMLAPGAISAAWGVQERAFLPEPA